MKTANTKSRILKEVLLIIILLLPMALKAQTATDSVPYCCDFENQVERAYWRYANSDPNKWTINNATQSGGLYSLYISNDGGITHIFSGTTTSSYAFRRIHIPAGIYEVSYDWVAKGYQSGSSYSSYMRAFLIPATTTFTGGTTYSGLSATGVPNGAIAVDGGTAQCGQSTWQSYSNPLVRVQTTQDYYLVFFWYNNSNSPTNYQPPAAVDNICITPVSCPQPMALTKTDLGSGCVSLRWIDYATPQPIGWIVEYGQYGFTPGTGTKRYTTSNPDTICGLQDDVTYDFMVRAICNGNDTSKHSSRVHVRYCSQNSQCIDFTDLTGPNVQCYYGTSNNYNNYTASYPGPWANRGVINSGGPTDYSQNTRHVVHNDPTELDICSGRQLSTVPPSACASVRLGTKTGSYLCQGIEYRWNVDTAISDVMLLQYACVFYNPGHSANQQPRFVLQILNSQRQPISASCGQADFNSGDAAQQVGNPLTGWHRGMADNWYWKDWTPVGVDLSPYHGQTIYIRLSSFACGAGASDHSGYAYYTLSCSKARLSANTCSEKGVDTMRLSAPAGFNYRWYSATNPRRTLSRDRTISITLDSVTYYCDVSFIEDSNCKFTLSTIAIPRFPHSKFSATIDTVNCQYNLDVRNRSFTSTNRQDTINNLGPCETFYWDFGDGTYSRLENPGRHSYRTHGTYRIMLISSIAEGNCSDTSYYTVTFNPPIAPTISGDSIVCINTRAHIQVDGNTANRFQWSTGATTRSIDVYPSDSTTYRVRVFDQLGCETNLSFHVDVDTVPLPIFEPQAYESCVPYTMSIIDVNPLSSTNTYSWSWGDGAYTYNNNTPTHTYSEVGSFLFRCDIKSAEGCYDTVYRRAYVYGFPHGSFSWNPPIITVSNPEVQFVNLTAPNPTNTYDWEVFSHTSNPVRYTNTFEPAHRWTGPTTDYSGSNLVRLITTNLVQTISGGYISCVDTVETTILVINDLLQFPNTVTPNGDGINDIFEIKNLIDGGGYTDNELYIYNHWGRKVFHKKNMSSREDFWDPAANNDPDGTYYFRFSAKGYLGDILRNGVIQVVR
ncbi:MAG: gliding motility-associated C-terminal domain-containing protein [Bacteroidales bacterium]|nr:gliding motility-associated C-terminal domain-containing protein [Bacteroidales bacterium]